MNGNGIGVYRYEVSWLMNVNLERLYFVNYSP